MFIANKIIHSVSALKIPHCSSQVCTYVTVSIGVTTMADFKGRNQLDLLKIADEALYMAKENGRNQVMFFSKVE